MRDAADRRGQLGEFSFEDKVAEGFAPGIMGRVPAHPMGRVRDNTPDDDCPSWLKADALLVLSRFLEQTFRNFQFTFRKPSLVQAPFIGRCINPAAGLVTIPGGAYGPGVFTTVVCHVVPANRFRAVITRIGQAAESAAAFSDLAWRITVNGQPLPPWDDIRIQLWRMVPPTEVEGGISLLGADEICIEARSLSATDHTVSAQLLGWEFEVRSEMGNVVGSTIVD